MSKKEVFKLQDGWSSTQVKGCSATEYATFHLNRASYDTNGAIEIAQAQAKSGTKALGRLIGTLFDKGILEKDEVIMIAQGYIPSWGE